MSLASLPHRIPFNLGGLVRPTEIKAYGLTGSIPAKLPFSLSSHTQSELLPIENIGWELVCRAYNDFQTVILRTADMTALSFSKELNAFGVASFTLNLEHNIFREVLNSGYTVETILDYENLWEIVYNGTVVFQSLGTAINDSIINSNEARTVTISGSGTGKVLEWASVYPVGFPDDITVKLEEMKDDFSGEQIDTTVWNRTPLQTGLSYTSAGMRREADAELDNLNQERTQLQQEAASLNTAKNVAANAYRALMKDKTSTAAEKQAALKDVNDATKLQLESATKLLANTQKIARVNAIKAFIGTIPEDDNYGHLKLTLPSAGSKLMTSGNYDIAGSGVSFGIEPGPSSTTGGQITTMVRIAHRYEEGIENTYTSNVDLNNFARMYVQRLPSGLRMYAEVSNNNEVTIEDWAYGPVAQRYWRIREDEGEIVFDTSPNNIDWVERFRSTYSWPTTKVVLQFGLELTGNVGIALPLPAYMFQLNQSTIPETKTAFQQFTELLEAAQAREVIPYVKTDYTDTVDSRGIAWIGKPDFEIQEGTKLSVALTSISQAQQADWFMDTDFTLKVFQKTKEDSTIPPVYFTKEDVVFHEGGSQEEKSRTRNREQIANAIVGKNAAGQYVYVEDNDSISKYQRREAFISAGSANDLATLGLLLDASLQELKDEKSSWRVVVAYDQPGRIPFQDYDIGDWISIETSNSQGEITVNQWRVVGIAIQVGDTDTTVELTLQSRMELLAERLKAQVDNLSASSAAGGTTIGSAISAATLVQQVTLAGLKDVVIGNPVNGQVLTYANGFWVPADVGDTTIPNTPVITNVYTNIYYPVNGVNVRAQSEVHWGMPTNTDGSFVTDGHHYELRYRPTATADYPATWAEAGIQDTTELMVWSQPTLPPTTNANWQTVYVSWDDTVTVIQELTPGVSYDLQIRAVDSSTPQHFSEWSETYPIDVTADTIAPSQPAPPVVASSTLGIQVTHYLGTLGEQFNLPPDMAYLEVHVGGPAFYPNEETMVGKIVADQGLILARTPAIQTFSLESTENVWVRVVAVDQTGNKSTPSGAATATITLVDDAHISDLTATKITAGTISSSIILAGSIKTAESGARAEMNYEGFRIYSEDDDPTVSLLGSPGSNGNFLLIKDLEDPTSTLASIDGTGRGSFQSVTVSDDITLGGDLLQQDILNPIGKGIISIGYWNGGSVQGGGPNVERGFLELSFIAEESRTYMICGTTEVESSQPTTGDKFVLRFRDGGEENPSVDTSPVIQQQIIWSTAGGFLNTGAMIMYAGTFTPGLHRILWTFSAEQGNAAIGANTGTGTVSDTVFWVEDLGLPQSDTVILNDGGIEEYNAPADPTKPSTKPKPKVTYTKSYSATWSGTYRSNGGYSASHGNSMVQGDSGSDNWLNDARSLCGFNYAQIMRDTAGSTIKACYVTLYANHWYWNDGGVARIGTHNYTSRPATWSGTRVAIQRVTSANWPKPGRRKVSLGTTIGNEFKSGASKGIALGPTTGNKTQYGKFNGNGQAYEPVLTIVYVK